GVQPAVVVVSGGPDRATPRQRQAAGPVAGGGGPAQYRRVLRQRTAVWRPLRCCLCPAGLLLAAQQTAAGLWSHPATGPDGFHAVLAGARLLRHAWHQHRQHGPSGGPAGRPVARLAGQTPPACLTAGPHPARRNESAAPRGGVFYGLQRYCLSRELSVTCTAVPPLIKKLPNWVCISVVTSPVGSKFSSGASKEL